MGMLFYVGRDIEIEARFNCLALLVSLRCKLMRYLVVLLKVLLVVYGGA